MRLEIVPLWETVILIFPFRIWKRFIRLICLFLVFASLAAIPAYAQENSARASAHLSGYRAYCTKVSSTSVGVSFQAIGTDAMDEIGANLIKVQYSSDQVNWTTAKTFRKASYPSMVDHDTSMHGAVLYATVPSGKYYRAYVEFYAEKDGGFSERYYYTEII